jgi:CII-binding regulator of phage lambda lysogenization HflD
MFWELYGDQIINILLGLIGTALTGLFTYIGIVIKNAYTKYINDKTKKDVVATVVQAVEQIYKDLKGEEKLEKGLEYLEEMLNEKGISCTDLELRMLLEGAVGEFNKVFEKGDE